MKKVLLLIIIAIISVNASAQDTSSSAITIDSLSVKLEKLQHDYDFLLCGFELYRIMAEQSELNQDIKIQTNAILLDIYNSKYNRDLYKAYLDSYDINSALFEQQKEYYEQKKKFVMFKAITSGFSETEISLIELDFKKIDNGIAEVKSSLKYYKFLVDAYRDKR